MLILISGFEINVRRPLPSTLTRIAIHIEKATAQDGKKWILVV